MRIVTICIVNYNGEDCVSDCVKSVLESVKGMDAQVTVIDNASEDRSLSVLQHYIPRIDVIVSEKNLGYAGGGQLGYSRTDSKYFVVLNNDLIVERQWAKELVGYMEVNPEVAIAGCRIKADLDVYNVGTYSLIGENIWEAKAIEQFYLAGACLIVRRSLVDRLFDPDYFMYCEDVWAYWLARLKGHKIGFAEKAVIPRHIGSHSIRKVGGLDFLGERNKWMMFFTFYQITTLVKLVPLFVLFLSMKGVRRQALIWMVKNFNIVISKRREIQAQRKLPDSEITRYMSSWVSHQNKTLNKISEEYCRLVGIKTVETASSG